MAGYRAWQIISVVFLGIGLLELLLRGLADGSRASLVVGLVSLVASASGFWEARSQRRNAEDRLAEIRRWAATGERRGPGPPR